MDQQIHGASVAGRRVLSSSMFVAVTAVRALMRPPLYKFDPTPSAVGCCEAATDAYDRPELLASGAVDVSC
ncbi:hypothetical protein [Streptomyces sp. NPDC046197]|uniref:hypothetical protein n=1 Tax=Streptomyces sp. NPDC046197 TaxID=3154337 RepID=UPI0033DB0FB4